MNPRLILLTTVAAGATATVAVAVTVAVGADADVAGVAGAIVIVFVLSLALSDVLRVALSDVLSVALSAGLLGVKVRVRALSMGKAQKERRRSVTGAPRRGGWSIAVLAACMAPAARRRWLALIAETLYDFEPAQHTALLRNFRRNAPIEIMRSWTVDFTRSGASR
jgi:hypothetical protein